MKKLIFICLFLSGIIYGQFTITDSSNDWKIIGKEVNNNLILINKDMVKIAIIDIRSKSIGFDPLSTFKSQNQRNVDNVIGELRKGNEGVKDGFYEFVFQTEPSTIENIYNIIVSHFKEKKKEIITLTFPEGNLYLDFNSKTAFYAVSFGLDRGDGQTIYGMPMLKSQVDKLFGKK